MRTLGEIAGSTKKGIYFENFVNNLIYKIVYIYICVSVNKDKLIFILIFMETYFSIFK